MLWVSNKYKLFIGTLETTNIITIDFTSIVKCEIMITTIKIIGPYYLPDEKGSITDYKDYGMQSCHTMKTFHD